MIAGPFSSQPLGSEQDGRNALLMTDRGYTPAAGRDWLLPFYDLFAKLLGVERSHRRLLEQAAIQSGYNVLEIGCGTGNLTILAKRLHASARVHGIDPDPKALSRARRKAHRADLDVDFRQAFSEQLPFQDASCDRVLSAFMLHHIQSDTKVPALREVYRVLKPSGSLHLADFEDVAGSRGHHTVSVAHQHEESRFRSTISHLLQEAGFADAKQVFNQANVLGDIGYFSAVRPPLAHATAA